MCVIMVISPIFYMGNKRKLVTHGLCELFPQGISTYYEPFAGSAVVGMNVSADAWYINDLYAPLYLMYNMFADYKAEDIISFVEKQIDTYGLPRERTKRNVYKDEGKIEQYKQAYHTYRKVVNEYEGADKALYIYSLMFFAFSQQMRFNNKGQFNMPFGNDCFSEDNKKYIRNGCDFFSRKAVSITQQSFDVFLDDVLSKAADNAFVYLDPPYMNTTAIYNEGGTNKQVPAWSAETEKLLYSYCDKLTERGISFALSNVFENKGKKNDMLIEWSSKYNVLHFTGHTYMACGKGNAATDEVLIFNYTR